MKRIWCSGIIVPSHGTDQDYPPLGLGLFPELNHIYVTLYHYDHPQSLEDNKDFTAYADVCFREFGSHVKFWTTINEANIFSTGGYNNRVTPLGRLFGLLLRELFH
ncbi:unnamed protein product [Brassica rapa]|uniref:Sinigrinase n=2 Tax=Brassica TaxID=3705 RepID=A0A816T3C6_BRANA|nr:unnamed protein product [Brassica napus]CAG7873505.1 unnamed protein product [Brassica rapa]